MKTSFKFLKLLFLTGFLFAFFPGYAKVLIVTNTKDSGAGSLRALTLYASSGDTIRFNPNLIAGGSDTITLKSEIFVKNKSLTIIGLYNSTDTLYISGNDSCRIFNFDNAGTIVLDSLVLVNGNVTSVTYWDEGGGAIQFKGWMAPLYIKNCVIRNNHSVGDGGAINANSLYIENSIITMNSTDGNGGGILCNSAIINNSRITNNFAIDTMMSYDRGIGGGICFWDSVKITNSTISGNYAYGSGGGIGSHPGVFEAAPENPDVIIINSTISGNTALENGGGILSVGSGFESFGAGSGVRVINSTITENTANGSGGGIYAVGGAGYSTFSGGAGVNITNSTINNNTANDKGGGIYASASSYYSYVWGGAAADASVSIIASTITGNTAGSGGGVVATAGASTNSPNGQASANVKVNVINSTITGNSANNIGGIYVSSSAYAVNAYHSAEIKPTSSIIAFNSGGDFYNNHSPTITSGGYNIFASNPSNTTNTDQVNITQAQLNLQPLAYNGGPTKTMLPGSGSVAINMGNPNDMSDAQNGPVQEGRREVGSAETCLTISSIDTTICNGSFVSPSGNYVWTQSGTYSDTLTNSSGCDSIITINLTVNKSQDTINPIACGSYISPSGKYIWTQSGTYSDTLTNGSGCDTTIVTIYLTVGHTTTDTVDIFKCEKFVSPSKKYVWTQSGTYMDTIPNSAGCDSILTINLTIAHHSADTIDTTVCNSYTSPSGNYVWDESGTYRDVIPNSAGCDSIITINLNVITVFTSVTVKPPVIIANAEGATYQWLNCDSNFSAIPGATGKVFKVPANGNYAVEVTFQGCTDTSECVYGTTAIVKNDLGNEFRIYPNPNEGNFIIDLGNVYEETEVIVIDAVGEVVYKGLFTQARKPEISIKEFPAGVYFVRVRVGSKEAIVKLYKE